MLSWINGVAADQLSVRDRGLAYGDGLFETIAVRGQQAPLLARHLERLSLGCQRLAIPLDMALFESELRSFITQLGDGVAKVVITRGQGQRGYAPPAPCEPQRIIQGAPAPQYAPANAEQGVQVFACTTRLAEQPLLAGLKHLNRLEQVLARAEWSDAVYAEGLMRDVQGRVIEGVFSNLFLVQNGLLLTPDLSRCGVAGVMRAQIIEQAAEIGLPVNVCEVSWQQLLGADEVMLCNSLYGIWPVRALASQQWPVGPVTRALQQALKPLFGG